jgi:hypothetical protein
MPSSTSNFDRTIPDLPWGRMCLIATVIVAIATVAWELRVRSLGYSATLNDTPDLWAERRDALRPDSLVIIGDSRAWFDLDLDELERGFGKRPVQLALAGSCAYPILAHLADDPTFRGTVLCSVVPGMFFAPGGFLLETSEKALKRYHTRTPAQRAGHLLAVPLEQTLAFLKQEELTLGMLLKRIPLPPRPGVAVMPAFPPYFNHTDRERRARMTAQAEQPGELRDLIRRTWLPLFTPPPPPKNVPTEAFMAQMGKAMESRMKNTVAAVAKIRERGGQVVFVRFPFTGELKKLEDKLTPRPQLWDPLVKATGAAAIYFEDHPELASFECPEWSHLSASERSTSKITRSSQASNVPSGHTSPPPTRSSSPSASSPTSTA